MRRLISFALTACLVLCGCTASASPLPKASRPLAEPPAAQPPQAPPVVFVLGDSYTAGLGAIRPEQTYAADTARALGWQVVIAGWRGTGYLTPGRVGKDFSVLFEEELGWRPAPDMIVISGGHNDWRQDPALVSSAAADLLTKIRVRWPTTHLVVLGPLWGGDPPRRALLVRDGLRDTTGSLGVPFIDPLRERWITGSIRLGTGNAPRYIRPDGTHPTRQGNLHLARRFAAGLRTLGLDRPRLGTSPTPRPARSPGAAATPGSPAPVGP